MNKEDVDHITSHFSGMSHEMRNALNILMASCTLAQSHIDDREKVLDYIRRIHLTAEQLAGIVDNILDMCQNGRDIPELHEKSFSIDTIEGELRDLLEPLAFAKRMNLSITSENFCNRNVTGDYGRLLQILINLATNSIKYTPEGGNIRICIEEVQSADPETVSCVFTCQDDGMGIPEDFIEHVFEPFARADDEKVMQVRGSGLGLSIVKEAVDTMGGKIHIDSVVDAGTTVTVRVKLRKNMRKG